MLPSFVRPGVRRLPLPDAANETKGEWGKSMVRHAALVLATFFLLFVCAIGHAADPQHSLVFGVVPQHSAVELARQWGPLLVYLEGKTGETLRFETAKDIPAFEQRLAAGLYDIAYLNPADYVQLSKNPGYRAFARGKGARLRGLVVVAADGPIRSLDDLDGNVVAFPAPTAFAAAVLPLAHVKARGIAVTPSFVGTHDSVYLAVARGYFPAGGGIRRTFDNCPDEVRRKLRVIWESPCYTSHPLAAHPRIAADRVDRIRQALIAMDGDPQGGGILAGLRMRGFEAGVDADWDDVRALDRSPPAGSR